MFSIEIWWHANFFYIIRLHSVLNVFAYYPLFAFQNSFEWKDKTNDHKGERGLCLKGPTIFGFIGIV